MQQKCTKGDILAGKCPEILADALEVVFYFPVGLSIKKNYVLEEVYLYQKAITMHH